MIRNFWIEANIDGRKEPLKGGSKRKDGGFLLSIYQREDGKIRRMLKIKGIANKDGTLTIHIGSPEIEQIITTKR